MKYVVYSQETSMIRYEVGVTVVVPNKLLFFSFQASTSFSAKQLH